MTNNKELFLKGTKNLFYIHIATLIGSILIELPLIGSWFGWINIIINIGIVFILFKLAPVNERYRKAALFMAIAVGAAILTKLLDIGILSFVGSICSLIAIYQEYKGHSEMMKGIDNKLADKWHGLFYLQVFGGFLLGLLSTPIIIAIGIASVIDTNLLAGIFVVLILGFDIIIEILYLLYMKRMHAVYEHFQPMEEREYI